MKNYLLLFTIGPVKSFIQESRKTQDLYASSALLSYLTQMAIGEAKKQFGDTNFNIITPQNTVGKVSIPNRFLTEIKADEKTILKKTEGIKKILVDYFSKIIINKKELKLPEGAAKQLKEHLDIRWVFYTKTNDYLSDFKEINKEMASIKNANSFTQITEKGRKCIVDGRLNVKFYRELERETIKKLNGKILLKKLYQPEESVNIYNDEKILKIWQIQKGEGVSAVTLKKRLFNNRPHTFPSTAVVSLMRLFDDLKANEAFNLFKDKVQNNVAKTYLNHSNDQLFYFDNIEPIFLDENKNDRDLKNCQKEHQKWSKGIPKKHFTSYYALIRFDGDKMGDFFSGVFNKDSNDLETFQKQLSKNIGTFSDEIQKIIKEPQGRVVYAGGEDFMAFVNIHYLKAVIDTINCKFKDLVLNNKLRVFIKLGTPISLSMGITIAHYKEPLQMILDKTATMEKLAKESGRNRFAIKISKHSGAQLTSKHTWDKLAPLFSIIQTIKNKDFSSAFLLNIYNFCEKISFSNDITKNVLLSKCNLFVKQAKTPGIVRRNIDLTIQHLEELMLTEDILDVPNFAESLLVIDFIQRQYYE